MHCCEPEAEKALFILTISDYNTYDLDVLYKLI